MADLLTERDFPCGESEFFCVIFTDVFPGWWFEMIHIFRRINHRGGNGGVLDGTAFHHPPPRRELGRRDAPVNPRIFLGPLWPGVGGGGTHPGSRVPSHRRECHPLSRFGNVSLRKHTDSQKKISFCSSGRKIAEFQILLPPRVKGNPPPFPLEPNLLLK